MKPIRVCIFVPSMLGGGAERMMVNLANEMLLRELKVDIVLVNAEGPYLEEIAEGVGVVDLDSRSVLRAVPALVRYFKSVKPDLIVSALTHANQAAIIARLISRVKTRLIISERSVIFAERMPRKSWKERLLRYSMKLLYPFSDGIVAISNGVKEDLERWVPLPPGHVRTIYNPVVTPGLESLSMEPVPHPWFGNKEFPVIIGAGRLTAQKDFHTLIWAFYHLRKKRPCRLVILGEGELREDLETLIDRLGLQSEVLLPGFQSNPFPWMRNADVFVFSSIWEGLGGVLIQAMACGTPVVSTDCPSGPAEILENGKWGRLVPIGDTEALSQAIVETLDEDPHPDVRCRAEFFSDKRSTDDYLKFCLGQGFPE